MKTTLLVLPVLLLALTPLSAQQKKASPRETVNASVDGAKISIAYGRPYTKDPKTGEPRKIWGGLVPFGKVWRTGADEATLLTTDKALEIGGTTIPAGTYSLFTIPEENGAKLIINKQTGQWGTRYDEQQDLARVDLKKNTASKPADQFTIAVAQNDGKGGELKLTWEDVTYLTAFSVKK